MKKILLITRNFPPLTGGMEKLFFNVYLGLRDNFQTALVAQTDREILGRDEDRIFYTNHSPLWLFLIVSFYQSIKAAFIFKPDIIISGSGLTSLAAKVAGLLSGAPVVTLVHGLDLIVDNKFYQALFIPAIRSCDAVIVNSRNTQQLAIEANINKKKISIIHPGVTIPENKNKGDYEYLLSRFSIGSRPVIISVGRLTKRKGIAEFIENSLPDIVKKIPDILFVVVGEDAINAINKNKESEKYRIKGIVASMHLEGNVLFTGFLSDIELQAFYAIAQVFIFPVIPTDHDVEGFGMVAIEAAAYGVPTVAFAKGGVVDAVKHGTSGFLVEPMEYTAFTEKVIQLLLSRSDYIEKEQCKQFAKKFSWNNYLEKLDRLLSYL
ncbi:MAG: glycosyltransferase family 1 protein [Gammaproteobacteria bacterium]|nr:MAG: glycosyltransferase family 1 protein [Gammaproteobacteria bacterium]